MLDVSGPQLPGFILHTENVLGWRQDMKKLLPEIHVMHKWCHRQRQCFSKEEEKCHSKTCIVDVVRQALKTKISFNIQVLINSSFEQQPVDVGFPQVVEALALSSAAPYFQSYNIF